MTANNNASTLTLPWLQHVLLGLETANTFTHNPLAKLLSAMITDKNSVKTKGTPTITK